jgi:hypothetical protein
MALVDVWSLAKMEPASGLAAQAESEPNLVLTLALSAVRMPKRTETEHEYILNSDQKPP